MIGSPEVGSEQRAGKREWVALAVLIVGVVVLSVDATVLYMAVPALTADLAPSATQILWIGDVYSFALAGLLVVMGNVADRVGRKRLLLIGSVAFGLASTFAALAWTPEMLIVARALLGVAGATIMPSTLSIVRNMFEDPAQRTRAIAVWAAGASVGAALGPLVGGALLEHFWWGSVFLINVPLMVIIVVAGWILLPESRNPNAGPVDVFSAVLSVVTIVAVVFAIKHAVGAGLDWQVPLSLVVGVFAGAAFLRRQRQVAVPLIDLTLFRVPAFSGAVVSTALAIFGFSGVLFFFSQYLQLVRGFSPLKAGVAELPVTIPMVLVIAFVGLLSARLGQGRALGLGLATIGLGLAGLGLTEELPSYIGVAISLAVMGLGVGVAMTLSTDAVVTTAPRERAGAAASISETAYELGVALGIAILGSMQTALYRARLDIPAGLDVPTRAAVENSLATAHNHFGTGADNGLLAAAKQAFVEAMQVTSFVAAGLLVLAAIVAWRVIPSEVGQNKDTHGTH
ncbi:MAG: MFS transporter [Mycobacterium sp.]